MVRRRAGAHADGIDAGRDVGGSWTRTRTPRRRRTSMRDVDGAVGVGLAAEVRVRADAGGGRGVFARAPIPAGAVVLAERPVVQARVGAAADRRGFPDPAHLVEDLLGLEAGARLEDARAVCCGVHPRRLVDVPREHRGRLWAEHAAGVAALAEACDAQPTLARGLAAVGAAALEGSAATEAGDGFDAGAKACEYVARRGGDPARVLQLLRLVLGMRFNAFSSGVYRTFWYVNHACRPNCVKLLVQPPGGLSELVAVRSIAVDEEITISYLDPPERSLAARRRALLFQHLFDPGASPYPAWSEAVLMPAESEAEVDAKADDEDDVDAAEKLCSLEDALDEGVLEPIDPEAEAERVASIVAQLRQVVPAGHLAVTRGNRRISELLDRAGVPGVDLALAQLRATSRALDGVVALHGPDHLDLAALHARAADALRELLAARDPRLFKLHAEEADAAWSPGGGSSGGGGGMTRVPGLPDPPPPPPLPDGRPRPLPPPRYATASACAKAERAHRLEADRLRTLYHAGGGGCT